MLALLLLPLTALATVPPECEDIPVPKSYESRTQRDFMQNYAALTTTLSPLHGPIPHKPGHGALGLSFDVAPPLSCARRRSRRNVDIDSDGEPEGMVDTYQNTNHGGVVPRLRGTFAFPKLGELAPYGGVAYLPPVTFAQQRTVLLSAEVGAGMPMGDTLQLGMRFHATQQKTVGDLVPKLDETDPDFKDFFVASTFGLDVIAGFDADPIVPYISLGLTDASTFVYIGDDGHSATKAIDDGQTPNNLHPYLGPTFSAGLDGLLAERFRFGAEFYGAPGGHWRPDKNAGALDGFGRYGRLYTARLRVAVEL